MSKNNNKKKKSQYIDYSDIITKVIFVLITAGIIGTTVWCYFNMYKPQEKRYIKNSRYAYNEISKVVYEIYRKNGKVYDKADEMHDKVCIELAKQLSKSERGNCTKSASGMPELNFVMKKHKIAILGLEREGEIQGDNIVKEFIIDVDGVNKGANEVGIDRVPVQIHSTGRMGGRLMPANCNLEDLRNYGIPRSKSCPTGFETDFLTTNIPFAYDVNQIGSKKGKIEAVQKNVSFIRADCAAFGGEIIAGDYCDDKGIYWLKRCYEEYYCGFEPTK